MQNISIDFISQYDVQISIDGERLKDIAGFSLKIKDGKIPKWSVIKKPFKEKKKPLKEIKGTRSFPKLRTINQAAKELKAEDPNTIVTDSIIRRLIRESKIAYIQDGNKQLVDLNDIRRYYENSKITVDMTECPKIRAIY